MSKIPPKPKAPPLEVRTSAPDPQRDELPPGTVEMVVQQILPMRSVKPSPFNPRKTFAGIDELAESLKAQGQLVPLLVRPQPLSATFAGGKWAGLDHFELVDGERRYRASQVAEVPELRADVRWLTDRQAKAIMLVSVMQRADVVPSERAAAARDLAGDVGAEEAARLLSLPVSQVRDLVRLAKLPAWALAAVDGGRLGLSVAGLIASVPGEQSRERAAACALLGYVHFADALAEDLDRLRAGESLDGEWFASSTPLTYAEAKRLIAACCRVELKQAPFSRKDADLVATAGSCEACPQRAGNNDEAKAEGVRGDVCLNPDCYRTKVAAYRDRESEKAAKKGWLYSDLEGVGDIPPKAWARPDKEPWRCDLHADFPIGHKRRDEPLEKLLGSAECQRYFGWDQHGRLVVLVKVTDARKALVAAGVLKKPEKPHPKKNMPGPSTPGDEEAEYVSAKPAGLEPAFRLYRVTNLKAMGAPEFSVASDATEDEIASAAADAVAEYLSYGWEAVPDEEADQLTPPAITPDDVPSAGSLPLAKVEGITKEDAACLTAVGIRTLADMERMCVGDLGRVADVLGGFPGAFTSADAERIAAAVARHLRPATAPLVKDWRTVSVADLDLKPAVESKLAKQGVLTLTRLAAELGDDPAPGTLGLGPADLRDVVAAMAVVRGEPKVTAAEPVGDGLTGEPIEPLGFTAAGLFDIEPICSSMQTDPRKAKQPCTVQHVTLNGRPYVITGNSSGPKGDSWSLLPLHAEADFVKAHPTVPIRLYPSHEGKPGSTGSGVSGPGFYAGVRVVVGKGKNATQFVIGLKGESRKLVHRKGAKAK